MVNFYSFSKNVGGGEIPKFCDFSIYRCIVMLFGKCQCAEYNRYGYRY